MDQILVTSISTLGFGTVGCIYLWKHLVKKDEENKIYVNKLVDERVGDLKQDIKELKESNLRERETYNLEKATTEQNVARHDNYKHSISRYKYEIK